MPNNAIEHRFPTTDKLALVEHYQGKPQAYRDLQAHNFHLGLTPLLHVHRAQSSTSIWWLTELSFLMLAILSYWSVFLAIKQLINLPSHPLGNFYHIGRLL